MLIRARSNTGNKSEIESVRAIGKIARSPAKLPLFETEMIATMTGVERPKESRCFQTSFTRNTFSLIRELRRLRLSFSKRSVLSLTTAEKKSQIQSATDISGAAEPKSTRPTSMPCASTTPKTDTESVATDQRGPSRERPY